MLNRSSKSVHLYLIPDLRGIALNLPLSSVVLAMGFSYTVFIVLRYVLLAPNVEHFYLAKLLYFVKSIEMII